MRTCTVKFFDSRQLSSPKFLRKMEAVREILLEWELDRLVNVFEGKKHFFCRIFRGNRIRFGCDREGEE